MILSMILAIVHRLHLGRISNHQILVVFILNYRFVLLINLAFCSSGVASQPLNHFLYSLSITSSHLVLIFSTSTAIAALFGSTVVSPASNYDCSFNALRRNPYVFQVNRIKRSFIIHSIGIYTQLRYKITQEPKGFSSQELGTP
jgi:hypothetical protein